MKNKIFFLVFVLFSTWSISAQERECGMEAHMAEATLSYLFAIIFNFFESLAGANSQEL